MKAKYQIFVSSTFKDLIEERELAIKAILEMGHIPVGMEMFSAGDDEQWKLIQKQIDDCDYYVVIVAHRYGSLDGKVGYTEKEYDYASSKGLPTLGFVIQDGVDWPVSKSDTETESKSRLDSFKSKIKKKIISYWTNKEDLYGKISIALMKQFTTNPRIGWIKANEAVGPEVLVELSRLSKENSLLRDEINDMKILLKKDEDEKYSKLQDTLYKHEIHIDFYYKAGSSWENGKSFSMHKVFKLLAPELIIEKSTNDAAHFLGIMLNPDDSRTVRNEYPIPSNITRQILGDLSILDLVKPSEKKRSVNDQGEYWTLTPDGRTLFKAIRRSIIENVDMSDDLPF